MYLHQLCDSHKYLKYIHRAWLMQVAPYLQNLLNGWNELTCEKKKEGMYSLSEVLTHSFKRLENADNRSANPLVFYRWDLRWIVSQNKKTECHSELMTVK